MIFEVPCLLAVGLWGSHQTPFRFLSEGSIPCSEVGFSRNRAGFWLQPENDATSCPYLIPYLGNSYLKPPAPLPLAGCSCSISVCQQHLFIT